MAACGFMLIAKNVHGENPETQARLIQGLIGGIGFIGGGAILKEGTNVRRLATASSIWCTGAIGAAVAFERTEIAVVLSLITFLTLRLFTPIVETDDYGSTEEKNEQKKKLIFNFDQPRLFGSRKWLFCLLEYSQVSARVTTPKHTQ